MALDQPESTPVVGPGHGTLAVGAGALAQQASEAASRRSTGPWLQVLQRTFRAKSAVVGLMLLTFIIVIQLFGYRLAPYNTTHINLTAGAVYHSPPSLKHPFGTDDLGRDILSRLLVGGRISIAIGFAATLISVIVGVLIGATSGMARGFVDSVLTMVTNWFLSFPFFLLALAIIAVYGSGVNSVVAALWISGWAYFARLLRGQVLSIRETEYVEAARASGAGGLRVLHKHILPNSMAPLMVVATLSIAGNITGEAGLSFLGVGVPPTQAITWGNMAGIGEQFVTFNPVEVLAPSAAIAITLIAVTLFGNALRDAADPKLKD